MKRWNILLAIAIMAVLMSVSTAIVSAEDEAGLSISKSADKTSAAPHETITYTYTIVNTGSIPIDNIALTDDKLGSVALDRTTLAVGDNVTATATYSVAISDLPGPIVNTAKVTGTTPDGKSLTATSNSVSVALTINKSLLTKGEILKLSGVRGNGIDSAPGLQKLFNAKSKAAVHAGKKDRDRAEEQLEVRQRTQNQSAEKGQLKIEKKVRNKR